MLPGSYDQIDPFPLIVSTKLKPDMVLEDVDSDNEGQQRYEAQTIQENKTNEQQTQSNFIANLKTITPPSETLARISVEDAETQTGRWTPFIQSIKKEAEDEALATMEER